MKTTAQRYSKVDNEVKNIFQKWVYNNDDEASSEIRYVL